MEIIIEKTRQGYVVSCPEDGGLVDLNSETPFWPERPTGEIRCSQCSKWFPVSIDRELTPDERAEVDRDCITAPHEHHYQVTASNEAVVRWCSCGVSQVLRKNAVTAMWVDIG